MNNPNARGEGSELPALEERWVLEKLVNGKWILEFESDKTTAVAAYNQIRLGVEKHDGVQIRSLNLDKGRFRPDGKLLKAYKKIAEQRKEINRLAEKMDKFKAALSSPQQESEIVQFVRLVEHKLDQRLQGQYTEKQILGMLLKLSREILLKYKIEPLDAPPVTAEGTNEKA